MIKTLESRIAKIEQEIKNLKTSQFIGDGAYRVYSVGEYTIEESLSANSGARYWIYFKGENNFPLVTPTFEVWENGAKVVPMASGQTVNITRTSLATYHYSYDYHEELDFRGGSTPIEEGPSSYIVLLRINAPYQQSVNVKIKINMKASCNGVSGVQKI